MSADPDPATAQNAPNPIGSHQTTTRVTRILEEVVYRPGATYAEVTRAIGAPKSSVYGFIRGLLAVDWLIEEDHRLYLGPAFYSLAVSSGHIRAGAVSSADLESLYRDTGLTTFVGVRAGDHLIYIAEAGSDLMAGFEARNNIRRELLETAGGKVLLAFSADTEIQAYLRRLGPESRQQVDEFLQAIPAIRETRVAVNVSSVRARTGIATVLQSPNGQGAASVTLVGPTPQLLSRLDSLTSLLVERVAEWRGRSSATPREPV